MFDDTISKIISEPNRDTIVEVPEYETEVTYSMLQTCWDHIIGTPFHSIESLLEIDEDYELINQQPLSDAKKKEEVHITNEFMT